VDLATIIGIIGAAAIIITAMVLSGGVGMFMDIPSILIVLVGSIFVVMAKFGLNQFLGAAKVAAKAFMFKSDDPAELIDEIVELADAARKGGLLSLEGKEVSSDFLQGGIQLLVDGHDPEVVKTLLSKDMNKSVERHEQGASIFGALADVSPAMGMIGTLVGLVQMLSAMDDPKSIGPAMAVALLTTFYGAVIANVICLPIAGKLRNRSESEILIKTLIIEGMQSILSGENPRIIEQKLHAYISPKLRASAFER